MQKQKIKSYLQNQDWMWKRVFCNFYFAQHNMNIYMFSEQFEISNIISLIQTVDELDELWQLVDYVNFHEDEIIETINNFRFCKPIAWQIDFVKSIAEKEQIPIIQTLDLDALTDAYCIALTSKGIDIDKLVKELDEKYQKLFSTVKEKFVLLKRNLFLTLESFYGKTKNNDADKLNFRELLEYYIPICGSRGIIDAIKRSRTQSLKIISDEYDCLAFAYYSPYFNDEINVAQNILPDSSIIALSENFLIPFKSCWEETRHYNEDFYDESDEDEEENNDLETTDKQLPEYEVVYADPQKTCLIYVNLQDNFYANIYIEKFPEASYNNSLPDIIRYRKGIVYTIEFVDNLQELPFVQKLNKKLENTQKELEILTAKFEQQPFLMFHPIYRQKMEDLIQKLNSCFSAAFY